MRHLPSMMLCSQSSMQRLFVLQFSCVGTAHKLTNGHLPTQECRSVCVVQIEPMGSFALDMLHEVVAAAGPRLASSHDLLTRLQIDLLAACLSVFRAVGAQDAGTARLPRATVGRMARLWLALHTALRPRMILQLDVFLQVRTDWVFPSFLLLSFLCLLQGAVRVGRAGGGHSKAATRKGGSKGAYA